MESFSLLRYWRGSTAASTTLATRTTTIAASLLGPSPDSETDTDEDDSGPFFDLEFAVPEIDDCSREPNNDEEDDREFKFAVSNTTLSLSPADDLFFKGRIAAADTAAAVDVSVACSEDPRQPIFPVSLLKSATKLRILMLRHRRSKPSAADASADASADAEGVAAKQHPQLSKFFVNFKVEEVPIVSLFTREGSGRAAKATEAAPPPPATAAPPPPATAVAAETRFNKEYVQKYLSKIKPLYVKVSKRYGEKIRFSGVVGRMEGETDGEAEVVGGGGVKSLPAGLKVMTKRLGKSKSAPLAVTAVEAVVPPLKRRDDSLLQLQDGIQSAIAHCKRSFNAPRGAAETPLVRSMSDPGEGRSEKPVNSA